MRTRSLFVFLVSLSVWILPSFIPAAAADDAEATISLANPAHPCAGEAATLTWTRPAGLAVTGYQIIQQVVTDGGYFPTFISVGPKVTSLAFALPFGLTTFVIRAKSVWGTLYAPFASATIMGNSRPTAMAYDNGAGAVGDRSATVPFRWYGPMQWHITGGLLPVTVAITAHGPGGDTGPVSIGPSRSSSTAVATFDRLTNGSSYSFSAVTSNACGSSSPSGSPRFVPGVGPAWTSASPPDSVTAGSVYQYKFAASGKPARTYTLLNAPSWLSIGAFGFVQGTVPLGTAPSSFSFSVKASNGVGVQDRPSTDIVAGPFTVTVTP